MKLLFLTVGLLAILSSSVYSADLTTAVLNYLESIHSIMPCGVPKLDIPVLAPFKWKEATFPHVIDSFTSNTTIQDLIVEGLNDIELITFKYNNATEQFDYDFKFPKIEIQSKYSIVSTLASINDTSSGSINTTFNDLHYIGSFKLAPNEHNHMELTNDNATLHIGTVDVNNWNNGLNTTFNSLANKRAQRIVEQLLENRVISDPKDISLWSVVFSAILKDPLTEQDFIDKLEALTKAFYADECKTKNEFDL